MTGNEELELHTGKAVERVESVEVSPQLAMVQMIDRAARDPLVNVDKMERLFALRDTMERDRRMVAYKQAMQRVHGAMPRIGQNGRISYNATSQIKYSLLEDIDTALRPLLEQEGLAISWDTMQPLEPGNIRVVGECSHIDGHSERKYIEFPPDKSGGKQPIQMHASAIKYGRRHLTKMFFNVMEGDEPDAEECRSGVITSDQAQTIESLLAEVGADVARFKRHFGVDKIAEIKANQLSAVHNLIDTKRRAGK